MENRQKSFTLIELLVVIAIIGSLASIVFVSLKSAKEKTRDAVEKSNLAQIRTGLEAYYINEGDSKYPWDTYRQPPTPPWTWGGWQTTPCNTICSSPQVVCTDWSTSEPNNFLEQLVQAGYFSRDKINVIIGNPGQAEIFKIVYDYTCDLQKFRLTVTLSDGSSYFVGNM